MAKSKWLAFIIFGACLSIYIYFYPTDFSSERFIANYKNTITSTLSSEYGIETELLNIVSTEELDKLFVNHGYDRAIISYVIFTSVTGEEYEAIVFAYFRKLYKLMVEVHRPIVVDKGIPFTQAITSIAGAGDGSSHFNMAYGVINDKRISRINMVFSDGMVVDLSTEDIYVTEKTKEGRLFGHHSPYGFNEDRKWPLIQMDNNRKIPLATIGLSDWTATAYGFLDSSLNAYMFRTTIPECYLREISAYSASGELIYKY